MGKISNIIKINREEFFKKINNMDFGFITGGFCGSGYLDTIEDLDLYRQPEEKEEFKQDKQNPKYDNFILTPLIPIVEIEADRVKLC